MDHLFPFQIGVWLGEGKISFSKSPETIKFFTKWQIFQDPKKKNLQVIQTVEMQGIEDRIFNYFDISDVKEDSFVLKLENELMGSLKGKGVIEPNLIAWEFHGNNDIEGFEVYERQENGDYSFRAEYTSSDQYRTLVEGLLWRKETS